MGNSLSLGLAAVFLLLFIALLAALKINPLQRKIKLSDLTQTIVKSKRERLTGRKLSCKERILIKIEAMLKRLGKSLSFFYLLLGLAFLAGVLIGNLLFADLFLAFATGFCFLPLPYLYLQLKTSWYVRHEAESLENAMSIITNAYVGCDDILKAFEMYVQEEKRYSSKISPFAEFVSEVLYINPNVERGLLILAEKVSNHYFTQWVKMLILCHHDRRLKFALRPIIDSMNDAKSIQMENETVMMRTWRDYFLTVALMFGIIPILRFANQKWFEILTETFVGKALIVLMLITALASAFVVIRINKPVGMDTRGW